MFRPIRSTGRKSEATVAIDEFKGGVNTLTDETRLGFDEVKDATNMMLTQDGRWTTRWGTAYYGPDIGDTIDGAFEAVKDDGTTVLLVVAGGALKRIDPAASTVTNVTVSGSVTLTAGRHVGFKQSQGYVYLYNGLDKLARYEIATDTVTSYTQIAAPGTITGTRTVLTAGSYSVYYQVVAQTAVGATPASATCTVSVNKLRDNWTAASEYITLTWAAVAGATRYSIYYTDTTAAEFYQIDNIPATASPSYVDDGTKTPNPYEIPPSDNTTGGPIFTDMEVSQRRLWGIDDAGQVRFSGLDTNAGNFSPFYGGGFIDLESGGRETAIKVKHYRSGKGDNLAVVFTSDPEGSGSIWQVALTDVTIGDVSFTVPAAEKIPGSIGSSSPWGVVDVRDAVMFPNNKGVYVLGPKPSILNVLATDELSQKIRPTWRSLRGAGVGIIAAHYYDAKVFFSVPYGASTNDSIFIFDTERRCWAIRWTFGVKQFLEYTDDSDNVHFLGVPTSGTRLIEIGESIQGDLGSAFSTNLLFGRYPVNPRNRLAWERVDKLYTELNQPQGTIASELLGTEKKRGFSSLSSVSITDATSTSGWDTDLWNSVQFNATSSGPTTYTQASVTKYAKVNKLINQWQPRITTTALNAKYTLLRLEKRGRYVPTTDPASYRT